MATIDVTEANFNDTISKEGIVLVDAWASWCGPCRAFAPVYSQVSEAHPEATFAKLDTEANQNLAAGLQIQAIPTLMIFRDGILLFRQSGALPEAALEDLMGQVEALDMDEVRKQIAEQAAAQNS